MRNTETTIWQFETRNFRVVASISPDEDVDTSFDETGETKEKIESGEWTAFQTAVRVYFRDSEISADYLGGSIYAEPRDFFREHIGLAAKSRADGVNYGSYFPGMVREAIGEARKALADMPKLRAVQA
jgi:hypothetical protein